MHFNCVALIALQSLIEPEQRDKRDKRKGRISREKKAISIRAHRAIIMKSNEDYSIPTILISSWNF
jgi:hypothetical protein